MQWPSPTRQRRRMLRCNHHIPHASPRCALGGFSLSQPGRNADASIATATRLTDVRQTAAAIGGPRRSSLRSRLAHPGSGSRRTIPAAHRLLPTVAVHDPLPARRDKSSLWRGRDVLESPPRVAQRRHPSHRSAQAYSEAWTATSRGIDAGRGATASPAGRNRPAPNSEP